jgi:hypothetical protein
MDVDTATEEESVTLSRPLLVLMDRRCDNHEVPDKPE